MRANRQGWAGTVANFLQSDLLAIKCALEEHHAQCTAQNPSSSQIAAWDAFLPILRSQMAELVDSLPNRAEWGLVLEFELPRERGRRPDLIILADQSVYVVEFKHTSKLTQAHVDQVLAYSRDLHHYHVASHHLSVVPILATSAFRAKSQRDGAHVCSLEGLASIINAIHKSSGPPADLASWLEAEYAPLPSLVDAARRIFLHEPLPSIRRAASAGVNDAVLELLRISKEAEVRREHHLVLVTGVPGAGKTLVGIQFVYSQQFSSNGKEKPAILLSGNGPLVTVLQHALKSSAFVRDVHGFLKEHGGTRGSAPREKIWVYDEAQRAWDEDQVKAKRPECEAEPRDFLSLGRRQDWALMVGLIGEGQEIHIGEEGGLEQWNKAIRTVGGTWTVHCPTKVSGLFDAAQAVIANSRFDLTVSLRSHLAEDVQLWVSLLLNGDLSGALALSEHIRAQGFPIYVSRDLEKLKRYVRERYEGATDKRYGILASSRDKTLPGFGVQNSYNWTRNMKYGPWYNDFPDSKNSCCQLQEVATEFACQGLELDFPIVAWGDDLSWKDGRWESRPQLRSKAKDPHRLRLNSYRVLLTRGRDGFALFVPSDESFDLTSNALISAGARDV